MANDSRRRFCGTWRRRAIVLKPMGLFAGADAGPGLDWVAQVRLPCSRLPMTSSQSIQVAVVMERIAAPNPWEDWRFRVVEVVPDEGVFGHQPRRLHDDGKVSRWLYPGFTVALYADECKGYFLNLTSGQPAWFVSWLVDEADPAVAIVTAVSVSYIEADRRMTADEHVENVALEPELCEWLRLFTNEHFQPETKRKVRAMSFLSPEERERHAAELGAGLPSGEAAGASEAAAPPTRNEALRHLFHTDPHFRESDGLDVPVDEVLEVQSSPTGRQRKILKARALGLLDDELTEQDKPAGDGLAGGSGS
jgi:hypothetical protein